MSMSSSGLLASFLVLLSELPLATAKVGIAAAESRQVFSSIKSPESNNVSGVLSV